MTNSSAVLLYAATAASCAVGAFVVLLDARGVADVVCAAVLGCLSAVPLRLCVTRLRAATHHRESGTPDSDPE